MIPEPPKSGNILSKCLIEILITVVLIYSDSDLQLFLFTVILIYSNSDQHSSD